MATPTTLIPACKKEPVAQMFLALARRKVRDCKVILADDGPGDEVAAPIGRAEFASVATLHGRFAPSWLRLLASRPSTDAATFAHPADRARPGLAAA